jgi:hypothetical protein
MENILKHLRKSSQLSIIPQNCESIGDAIRNYFSKTEENYSKYFKIS